VILRWKAKWVRERPLSFHCQSRHLPIFRHTGEVNVQNRIYTGLWFKPNFQATFHTQVSLYVKRGLFLLVHAPFILSS
jgi:hypothetical protein